MTSKAVPSNNLTEITLEYQTTKGKTEGVGGKAALPCIFWSQSPLTLPCCPFEREVIIGDHIYGAVPEPLCSCPHWDKRAGCLTAIKLLKFYLAVATEPKGLSCPNHSKFEKSCEVFESSSTKVARAHFKGTSTVYSWSFSTKPDQEGMSGKLGARKAAFDGAREHRPGETKAQPKGEGS